MNTAINVYGQPIGFSLPNWNAPGPPAPVTLTGRYCLLEPIDPERHARDLYDANALNPDGRMWTYLHYGPFETFSDYIDWMKATCLGDDPLFFAIVDPQTNRATGVAGYLRIQPAVGVIEVGHLAYSPRLQRSRAATEAMYLLMKHAFSLGYRRYEWKCDSLNEPSRRAALRLGFTYEGIFRQAIVVKGRNRDTAWYSIIDSEWPALDAAFQAWLDSGNFDDSGEQCRSLGDCIAAARQ